MRMQTAKQMGLWRYGALALVPLAMCVWLAMHGPIVQDQDYHRFADGRAWFGMTNAWNVLSNLPFLLFGAMGMAALWRDRGLGGAQRPLHAVFFAAASLVAAGSAYYHAAPSDATLVWDRLPMTLAFMAFFAAILGRHVSSTFARRALIPLLLIGLSTVLWWQWRGDLRPYLLVQFVPVLTIPAVLSLFPVRTPGTRWLWWVLVAYASAKGLETYDANIYAAIGIGGHALKHVAASLGVYFVLQSLRAGW
jgi:hypothetical protein